MKKSKILLAVASSFALVSCDAAEGLLSELSLSELSESSLSSLEESSSSSEEPVSIKGDTSRTYLNNALETSFAKKALEIDVASFNLDASSREYTLGEQVDADSDEYSLVKTTNVNGYSVASPNVIYKNVGRDKKTHAELEGYFGIKDATYITTENGVMKTKDEHQYSNIYLKDNKYYFDCFDDQGNETLSLSNKINEILESLLNSEEMDTPIEFGAKGYIDINDNEDALETLDSLMPKTSFTQYLPTLVDMLFDGLTDVDGAELTYEGFKTSKGKSYTTSIRVTGFDAIFEGVRNIIDDIPDIIDDFLGDSFDRESILEMIDEVESTFASPKEFDLDIVLEYTPTSLDTITYSFEYEEAEGASHTVTIEEGEETASYDILEKMSFSGEASFDFSEDIAIDYPSFDSYPEVEIPEGTDDLVEE